MLFFGHRFIKSENFYHISTIDAIINTPPSSTLYLEFSEENLDIINYLKENSINFVLSIKDIKELLYASALGASYILVEKELASVAQSIAESYLFDAKILVMIESDDALEELATQSIDGVLYSNAIVKISS